MSPIKYETASTVFVYCTDCPGFRVHASDRSEAYRRAMEHQQRSHRDDKKMRDALTTNKRRNPGT